MHRSHERPPLRENQLVMLNRYSASMTVNTPQTLTPWRDWPHITDVARTCGWQLLAERAGVGRFHREDARAGSGAVDLSIEFDTTGGIRRAWMSDFDRRIGAHAQDKLDTIIAWLREDRNVAA